MIGPSRSFSLRRLSLVLVLAACVAACDSGPASSIYDPDHESLAPPEITAMDPAGEALAGVSEVTLTGANFSPVAEDNLVYFSDVRAPVLSANPTRLVVRSPNVPGEHAVRATVIGAEFYSNPVAYTLRPAVEEFGDVQDFEEPFALAVDADGTVYVSLFANNASIGIVQIAPDGTRTTYAETPASIAAWNGGYAFPRSGSSSPWPTSTGPGPPTSSATSLNAL